MPLSYINVSLKRDFWKELSSQISGKFKINLIKSNSHESLFLNFTYEGIDIEFSENDTQPLKVKFSSSAKRKCNISISGEDFIEKIVKFFGGNKEIQVGNPEFDNLYLVQGDDEVMLRRFVCKEIQTMMLALKVYSLNCKMDEKTDRFEFSCTVSRQVSSLERLQTVYKLTCLIVDNLKDLAVL